jgi:hypothetical protein
MLVAILQDVTNRIVSRGTMIVDSHLHVWSSDPIAYPWQPLLAHVPPPTYAAPVERLLADMARAEVDKAILVQPSVYGRDHSYLIDSLKAAPDRFIGVGLVDLRSTTPREDFLDLIAKGLGGGLRLNTILRGDVTRLAGPDYQSLFDTAEEMGVSVAFQMDIEQAPVIARLAVQHRSLPLIVDYLGPDIHARPMPRPISIFWRRIRISISSCSARRKIRRPPIHFPMSSPSIALFCLVSGRSVSCMARTIRGRRTYALTKSSFNGARISRTSARPTRNWSWAGRRRACSTFPCKRRKTSLCLGLTCERLTG